MKRRLLQVVGLSAVAACASAPPPSARTFQPPATMQDGPLPRKVTAQPSELSNDALALVATPVLDYSQKQKKWPDAIERTLPSGIRLVVVPDHAYPSVNIAVIVGRRRSDPTPQIEVLETVLDWWARHQNGGPDVYDAAIIAGSRDSDAITFQVALLSSLLPVIGPRFFQRLTRTDFERRTVDRFKDILVVEATHPTAPQVASKALWRALYPAPNGYGDQSATAAELEPVSSSDVETLRSAMMTKDNILVAAMGDVDIDKLGVMVERELAALPATSSHHADSSPPASACSGKITLIDRPGSQQAWIRLGWPTVPASHAEAPALRFLAAISGTSFESRLNRSIRLNLAASYGVQTYASFFKDAGAFTLETSLDPTKVGAALGQIDIELARLGSESPSKAETANGIQRSTISHYGNARALGLARYRGANEALPKVDDAKAAAQRYLTKTKRCVIVVGDAKMLEPELSPLGEVVVTH